MDLRASRSGPLQGQAAIPGDKSCSHRALILGALAEGETRISGLLEAEDVLATARALETFGAGVERQDDGEWRVRGAEWRSPAEPIDCGNSGTAARLLMGAASGFDLTATFSGDASLSSAADGAGDGAAGAHGRPVRGRRLFADHAARRPAGRRGLGQRAGLGAGEIRDPARRPPGARVDRGARAGAEPRSYGNHAARVRLRGFGGRWRHRPGGRAAPHGMHHRHCRRHLVRGVRVDGGGHRAGLVGRGPRPAGQSAAHRPVRSARGNGRRYRSCRTSGCRGARSSRTSASATPRCGDRGAAPSASRR